jgi:hypothetical protein
VPDEKTSAAASERLLLLGLRHRRIVACMLRT